MSTVPTSPMISRLADADMQGAPAALIRAAQRAREMAARTGTPLVVVANGKLIEISVVPKQALPENTPPL